MGVWVGGMASEAPRVIITGSEGLIGRQLSESLSKSGWHVIPCDLTLGHDLLDENFVKGFFAKESAAALVNLFALNDHYSEDGTSANFLTSSLGNLEHYLTVNVVALFSVCREFIRSRNHGKIVNFSSIYSSRSPRRGLYNGGEKNIGYGISKAAGDSLTKQLAVLAAPNFLVNAISPGGVEHEQGTDFQERYARLVPIGRMAHPNDFSDLVRFLIGPGNTYLTGSIVVADGGFLA